LHQKLKPGSDAPCSIATDQSVRRAVVLQLGLRTTELRSDVFGQDFAQLNPPLVKTIHVPDDPMNKHLVLVRGHQSAERMRRQAIHQKRVGRTIALKDSMID